MSTGCARPRSRICASGPAERLWRSSCMRRSTGPPTAQSNVVTQICATRYGRFTGRDGPLDYVPEARGYLPFVEGNGHAVRVLPCRYAAYIAASGAGDEAAHGPMRCIHPDDSKRRFWIPLHKLFPGDECLRGHDITVRLTAAHVNEKLRRVHLFFCRQRPQRGLGGAGPQPGSVRIHERHRGVLAAEGGRHRAARPDSSAAARGAGDLQGPCADVPGAGNDRPSRGLAAVPARGLEPEPAREADEGQAAPEYVHVRHKVQNGQEIDLNQRPDMSEIIRRGRYQARHYIDSTGDGWIGANAANSRSTCHARCRRTRWSRHRTTSPGETERSHAVDGRVRAGGAHRDDLAGVPGRPEALSDQRLAANLELDEAGFERDDDTMTAIVGRSGRRAHQPRSTPSAATASRHSPTPPRASSPRDGTPRSTGPPRTRPKR